MRKRISHYQPWEILQTVKNPRSAREPKPFRALIVPGGVYGGGASSPVHQLAQALALNVAQGAHGAMRVAAKLVVQRGI